QVEAVQRAIARVGSGRILEIAPGPGRITCDVRAGGRLCCLEYNQQMIERGRSVCQENVRWIQGDAFNLPFSSSFDLVYSFRFVRHFQRSDRDRLYRQIRQVLKPAGWLVLDAVNERVSAPLRRKNPQNYPIYDKLYGDPSELCAELGEAGFEVRRLDPVQTWFTLQYRTQVLLGPRSRRLCRWIIRPAESIRRGPPLEWVVTAQKVGP